MINLDGSHGEGGGQMLRSALLWSLVTRTPFRMDNIRAGRKKPGLKAQHVHVLKSLLPLGPVGFTGAAEGSSIVTFSPARLRGADYRVDIGTAGSIALLLQTLLPAALLAEGPSRIVLTGGTDVAWSPAFDYLRHVALGPAVNHSLQLKLDVERRGFYPKGGGKVKLETAGWKPAESFDWTRRGQLVEIRVMSVASADLADRRVAERQSESAAAHLAKQGVRVRAESSYAETFSPGSVVTCVADFAGGQKLGSDVLGERGKRAEQVGQEAAEFLCREIESGGAVDQYAADQLIPWLALAGGAMKATQVTEHSRTAMWVAEQFLGKVFECEGVTIRCPKPYPGPLPPWC